jgi:hypothetical protein
MIDDETRRRIHERAKELAAAAPPLSERQKAMIARAFATRETEKPISRKPDRSNTG